MNWLEIKAIIFYTLMWIFVIAIRVSFIVLTGYVVYLIIIAVIKEIKKPSPPPKTRERFSEYF